MHHLDLLLKLIFFAEENVVGLLCGHAEHKIFDKRRVWSKM